MSAQLFGSASILQKEPISWMYINLLMGSKRQLLDEASQIAIFKC